MTWPLAVLGGGAAGMMAAITAAERGLSVLLIERNPRPGKKVLVSGNGRCNLTNLRAGPDHYYGQNPHFVKSPLARFTVQDTLEFFEELGLEWREEQEGRVFPLTNQAASVLELLEYRLAQLKVNIIPGSRVTGLEPEGGCFRIDLAGGKSHRAMCVIVALGSNAHPQLGTTGDGYELMSRLGHSIVTPYPTLVSMLTPSPAFHRLQGLRLQVEGSAFVGDRLIASRSGEILFTAQGVSGPIVLALSAPLSSRLLDRETLRLRLNLMPGHDEEMIDHCLEKRWSRDPGRTLDFSFVGLVPKKLGLELVALAQADGAAPVGSVSQKIRRTLARLMSGLDVPISGLGSFQQAEVSGGGISTDQVSSRTLGSRLHKGLFVAGEILDVHGDWGGFNLQFAWSTGRIAGLSASEK